MVKIKICGLTNIEDYNAVVSLNADYTGFIFYNKSPRNIDRSKAKKIIDSGLKGKNKKVGVFVNETLDTIKEIYDDLQLDVIQLHGDENPDYCKKLNLPFWKTIRVADLVSLKQLEEFDCSAFLLDKFSTSTYGGTGQTIDIELAQHAVKSGKKIIIAGGLSVENVVSVLSLSPYGIDANSSLESSPGRKSPEKLKQFFKKVREYGK